MMETTTNNLNLGPRKTQRESRDMVRGAGAPSSGQAV